MPGQEVKSQKVVGSNPGAGKRFFLQNLISTCSSLRRDELAVGKCILSIMPYD